MRMETGKGKPFNTIPFPVPSISISESFGAEFCERVRIQNCRTEYQAERHKYKKLYNFRSDDSKHWW